MKLVVSYSRAVGAVLSCGVILSVLGACGAPPASTPQVIQPPQASAPPPAPAALPPVPATADANADAPRATIPFPVWLSALRQDALARGIRGEIFDAALGGMTPSARVIELDRSQPEVKATYAGYMVRRLTGAKIADARQEMADNFQQLKKAEAAYGVPAQVIVGIWGQETNFGGFIGNFPVLQALASLAYDGRRAAMFREELMQALAIINQGQATIGQMRGSWAGAFGQPQFMPSSYVRYAVDGDGDGRRDIWANLPDVFGSIGNYLKQNGWTAGQGWGLAVAKPPAFDVGSVVNPAEPARCKPALRKHSLPKPISAWKALGFVPNGGASWPPDDTLATLLFPDGPDGPGFLTLPNYQVILSYNCSNYYALSVLLLADAAAQ